MPPGSPADVAARWGRRQHPGSLDDLLRDVPGSATGPTGSGPYVVARGVQPGLDPASIIGDVLGGILGGGCR